MRRRHHLLTEKQDTDLIVEDAFRNDEIICLICGKGGMKTLARHLNFIHNLKPTEYRKLFGIKSKRPLTSKNYEQSRREFVKQKQAPDLVHKARAAKAAKLSNDKYVVPPTDKGNLYRRGYRRKQTFEQAFSDMLKALRSPPIAICCRPIIQWRFSFQSLKFRCCSGCIGEQMALKDVRVLIVDDEAFFRDALRQSIGKIGFTVVAEAANGREAVAMFLAHRPHITFMDLYMPDKNGLDATREIIALDPNARVLSSTASDCASDAQAALKVGAKGIIRKPFEAREIYETVRTVLCGDRAT